MTRSGGTSTASAAIPLAPIADPEVRAAVERIRDRSEAVRREDALLAFRAHKALFKESFDVDRLVLFGSVARDEATPGSDLDVLVEFAGAKSRSKAYFGLMFYLEDLLDREIDLVTEPALRREFRPYVEREAIRV